MGILKWLTGTASGLLLISCVTINIYFPAAAAEKAADRIIEDVWGSDSQPNAGKAGDKQSSNQTQSNNSMAMAVLNWLVPPANAEGANININSPAINALRDKMKTRHEQQLQSYYESGVIGLTDDGLIAVRDAKAVPLKDRNTVNSLVAEENKDRMALYAEIARANGHPEWQKEIQETFAKRWMSNAPAGWWYQQGGSWKQN